MQRDIDDLSLAAVRVPVIERREHADHAMQRGERIADRDTAAHGHAAGLAGQMPQPAHCLADRAKSGQIPVRTRLAVPGNAQHDEPRVEFGQLPVIHPPPFQRSGPEVLDEHVGLGNQFARDVLAVGTAQVQRERALVARLHLPPD